ncbi:MAG: site-specific DNA-methyltransferase [Elusimicrobia bacterium]|nr:site-specific DNA-methyltransferase [Elusimicrobiota bacterium]
MSVDLFGRPLSQREVTKSGPGRGPGRTRKTDDIRSRIEAGDCIEVLRRLADEGVQCDSCVTDPPYHLLPTMRRFQKTRTSGNGHLSKGFMGQQWDGGDVAFQPETWRAVSDVLRPGAFLLAFGGTRTYHRMVCAIEDAGFVVQDMIPWVYSTGFPKNKFQLKPAQEPICLAYKPGGERVLNTDECRIETSDYCDPDVAKRNKSSGWKGTTGWKTRDPDKTWASTNARNNQGRYPSDFVHDGSDEVLALLPRNENPESARPIVRNVGHFGNSGSGGPAGHGYEDASSVARFFYSAKPTDDEKVGDHPTQKPVSLMRWLVRLVTPEGGTVLDPFAGTGTTGAAAIMEGVDSLLIEREEKYLTGIDQKLSWARRRRSRPLY